MSEYKDFSRCVICRSKQNLHNSTGGYEVTMLLNTLYLAVMHPIERRSRINIEPEPISN